MLPCPERKKSHRWPQNAVAALPFSLHPTLCLFPYGFSRTNPVSDIRPAATVRTGAHPRASGFVSKKSNNVSEQGSRDRAVLMARVQDGDRECFRALLDDIAPMLTNFLRRRIADRGELEDVYQETLMAFFQARHTYDPSRPFEPWIFAIARNIAADHARRYWTRATFEKLTETTPEGAGHGDTRFESRLSDAMAGLPDQQREAFSMLKLEGLSIEQAAQRAGTSVGALRVRAHRAYKALKRRITE